MAAPPPPDTGGRFLRTMQRGAERFEMVRLREAACTIGGAAEMTQAAHGFVTVNSPMLPRLFLRTPVASPCPMQLKSMSSPSHSSRPSRLGLARSQALSGQRPRGRTMRTQQHACMLSRHPVLPMVAALVLMAPAIAALKLKFHPDYSPPDRVASASDEARYLAYNKPVLSPTARKVKVLIQDDIGNTVTTVGWGSRKRSMSGEAAAFRAG